MNNDLRRGFLFGAASAVGVLFAVIVVTILFGWLPSGADAKPGKLEHLAAVVSLHQSITRESRGLVNPLPPSDATLLAGIKSYAANCAVCHGTADGASSTLAKGFYIKAPLLAKDGVEDDSEAVTFVKIKHGIRFSAMPAFGASLPDSELWQITSFLKHMDGLTPAATAAWKHLPSAKKTASR